jgi:gliding motility-associated protein GldM
MSLPKEPRQKMINMMYLVLTALLALNVSSEILNAFKTVNNSLVTANGIIADKNNTVYSNFQSKMEDQKTAAKAAIWQPKALEAKRLSDETYNYLENLKQELKKQSDLKNENGVESFREDNIDAPTRFLVEGPKGKELEQRLTTFKNQMLGILKPEEFNGAGQEEIKKDVTRAIEQFRKSLPLDLSVPKTQNQGNKDWQSSYFRMTPTIAAITIISKFQNDVRNSESQMVDYFIKKVGEVVLEYDQFQAIASQSSEYLMPGQELTITGGVGAFSKAAAPVITIDGATVPLNSEGIALKKFNVEGPGSYTKRITISYKKPDGTTDVLNKEIKYTVGSPTGASVSADAVKVLYIGLDNPLTITGGTKGAEATQASINNGSLKNLGGGKFIANVSSPGKATINVIVDGKSTPFDFRVKNVPNPIAMIGQNEGGRVAANVIKSQQGVRADLRDFVFEGVKFDIVGFTVYATGAGFADQPGISPNSGAYFNADSKRVLEKLRPGSTLVIDEISAVGPGGGTRKLQPLVFNLY